MNSLDVPYGEPEVNLYTGKRGGFRRLPDDLNHPEYRKPCQSSEHDPPGAIVLPPGSYEYTCPDCGQSTVVNVPEVRC